MAKSRKQVERELKLNDPPIMKGQFWRAFDSRGRILREVRIVAPYHNGMGYNGEWIIEETGKGMWHRSPGLLGRCPEFNLRYVFRLKNGRT